VVHHEKYTVDSRADEYGRNCLGYGISERSVEYQDELQLCWHRRTTIYQSTLLLWLVRCIRVRGWDFGDIIH
jgi:hypothetical protein